VSIGTFPYVVFVPLGTILAPQAPGTILAISNFRARKLFGRKNTVPAKL
jgi:hypothetical protein